MFPFGTRLAPPSKLPWPVPPFHGETTKSYLYRLAVANHLQPDDLHAHLTGTRAHTPITIDELAAVTGRSPHTLIHALPELRPGIERSAGPPLPGHVRRTICWRCAARRGAFIFATTWKPAEVTLCPRHQIWLGPPVHAHHGRQYDVHDLPDILHAQRRHYRLVRHYGRQQAADALAEAADVTAFWARHRIHSDRRKPLVHALLGRKPLTGRIPVGDPITPVVTYPETVGLAHVLAMPRSRELTHSADKHQIRQFRRDIKQHLGIDYKPQNSSYDPLFRWLRKAKTTTDSPPVQNRSTSTPSPTNPTPGHQSLTSERYQ